jgi:hypothetical protein
MCKKRPGVDWRVGMKDIYEHLNSYGLIKPGKVHQRLSKFSENKLSKFLETYLSTAKKRRFVLSADTGAIDIYPDSFNRQLTLDIIQRLPIYANRIYMHDPLIQQVSEWQNLDFNRALTLTVSSREERVQY